MIVRTAGDLGRLIRSRRRALGLGQQELADLVGVSRLWVVEFEKGKPRAEVGLVLRTLTALGLEVDVAEAPKEEDSALERLRRMAARKPPPVPKPRRR